MATRLIIISTLIFLLKTVPFVSAQETILEENFEDLQKSEFFSKADFKLSNIFDVSGKNALNGNSSIGFNTLTESGKYPVMLRFPKESLEGGRYYKISFKYKILQFGSIDGVCYAYMEGRLNGKNTRYNTVRFGDSGKLEGEILLQARVPAGANGFLFLSSKEGGVKIVIDNLKISSDVAPKESDWMFEENSFLGMRFLPTDQNFMDLKEPMYKMTKEQFFPFVDKYGQFKHKDWKGKIHTQEDFKERLNEEEKFFKKYQPIPNRDEFFGLIDDNYKYEATGKFRVQKVDGKWFLITPNGNLYWALGIHGVGNFQNTPITDRENYFEDISNKKYISNSYWGKFFYERKHNVYLFGKQNADLKYGEDIANDYGQISSRRLKSWGINSYGASTPAKILSRQEVPFTTTISSVRPTKLESKQALTAYWTPFPDYFDPNFESKTIEAVKKNAKLLNSPFCIGVFIDNELPWQNTELTTAKAVLRCPSTQFSKIAFKEMLEKKYQNIADLNKAWLAKYADWDDFLKQDDFIPQTKEAQADLLSFERKIYERYYGVCRKAVKIASPNTLYLGCRLAWTNPTCSIVATQYCDVVSYNLYRNDVKGYKHPDGAEDKPIIIGEFHFGNQDRGVFGGGLRPCATLAEKVKSYENYSKSAIENPLIIGEYWFQWSDQCTSARGDGENYSIGFVDICDTPIYEMAKAARKLSKKMYKIRLDSQEVNKETSTEKTVTY